MGCLAQSLLVNTCYLHLVRWRFCLYTVRNWIIAKSRGTVHTNLSRNIFIQTDWERNGCKPSHGMKVWPNTCAINIGVLRVLCVPATNLWPSTIKAIRACDSPRYWNTRNLPNSYWLLSSSWMISKQDRIFLNHIYRRFKPTRYQNSVPGEQLRLPFGELDWNTVHCDMIWAC